MDAPEFKLLLECCRRSFTADADSGIRRWSEHVDWNRFLRLARRHRVQGLVAQALYRSGGTPPTAIATEISDDAAAIAQANLRAFDECVELAKLFHEASIPILFVKGLSLSALAYGDPFVKMSADLDILVEPSEIEAAATILRDRGYHQVVPADPCADIGKWHGRHKESIWVNDDAGVALELHSRLADHPALIPGIGIASPRQDVKLGHGRVLPTLNGEDLIAYLCIHGASSAWFRLKWIVDLVALIHADGRMPEEIYRSTLGRGAGRAPAQAFLLAHRLSLLRLPEILRRQLEADLPTRILVQVALAQLLTMREPLRRPFGTAWIHLSQPLLVPGLGFKISEVARQATEIFDRRW